MYSSSYDSLMNFQSNLQTVVILTVVAIIFSLIGSLVIYFLFLSKKNDGRFDGFLGWLYDFLSFKKLMLESLLKILYLFCTLLITISGIFSLFSNFFAGLLIMIIGNIVIRVTYEFSIMKILVCKNTSEINSKMNAITGIRKNDPFTSFSEPKIIPKDVCPACGKKVKSTAKFCPFCGTEIDRKEDHTF